MRQHFVRRILIKTLGSRANGGATGRPSRYRGKRDTEEYCVGKWELAECDYCCSCNLQMGLFAGLIGGIIQSSNQASVEGIIAFVAFSMGTIYHIPRHERVFDIVIMVGLLALAWSMSIVAFVVLLLFKCSIHLYRYGRDAWFEFRESSLKTFRSIVEGKCSCRM